MIEILRSVYRRAVLVAIIVIALIRFLIVVVPVGFCVDLRVYIG